MSHSCRALALALSITACSNQKGPEAPAADGTLASAADAGVVSVSVTSGAAVSGAAVSGAVTGAESPSSDAPAIETLFVRGALADCQGEAPRKCLAVRSAQSEPWRNFFATIEGFQHDPAFDAQLRVEVSHIDNAPADASSLRYRLVEVVSKTPAAAP